MKYLRAEQCRYRAAFPSNLYCANTPIQVPCRGLALTQKRYKSVSRLENAQGDTVLHRASEPASSTPLISLPLLCKLDSAI